MRGQTNIARTDSLLHSDVSCERLLSNCPYSCILIRDRCCIVVSTSNETNASLAIGAITGIANFLAVDIQIKAAAVGNDCDEIELANPLVNCWRITTD